jgi:hypothetical protein
MGAQAAQGHIIHTPKFWTGGLRGRSRIQPRRRKSGSLARGTKRCNTVAGSVLIATSHCCPETPASWRPDIPESLCAENVSEPLSTTPMIRMREGVTVEGIAGMECDHGGCAKYRARLSLYRCAVTPWQST